MDMRFRGLPPLLRQFGTAGSSWSNPKARALLVGTFAFLTAMMARGEDLTIAVASNFAAPMQAIATKFEARSGHRVKLAFASSGKIFAQIRHGAPFDAFFSADQEKPARLVALGLAETSSRFTYAEGRLVLWSSQKDLINEQGAVLKSGNFNKLAIANPKLAPYGAAALEALERLKLVDSTRDRWVQGENISQTYLFVASGNADLGLVAASQVIRDGSITAGSAWILPESLYAPIRQDAVILKHAADSPALMDFWSFLKGPTATAIIRAFGYTTDTTHKATREAIEIIEPAFTGRDDHVK